MFHRRLASRSFNTLQWVKTMYDELDYIAAMLYQKDALINGRYTGARWWCLRDELKAQWRRQARGQVLEWQQQEESTQRTMQDIHP